MMHSIHALPTRTDHRDHMQQLQHQQSAEQEQTSMTVLESLDPAQQQIVVSQSGEQVLEVQMDSLSSQHLIQQQQQQHGAIQHQQASHLHQLQPSHTSTHSMDSTSNADQEQQLGGGGGSGARSSGGNQTTLCSRLQSDGMAQPIHDGGGPIAQWLKERYEIAEGESLPRSNVYNHYLTHCRRLQIASVNAASFGKLIRSVFVGLKTRRLGTRGHSKYHYFGVRAKPHVKHELLQQSLEMAGCSRDLNNENSNQNTDNTSETDSTNGTGMDCARLSSSGSVRRVRRSLSNVNRQTPKGGQQIYADSHHHHHQHQQPQQQSSFEQQQHQEGVVYYHASSTETSNGFGGSKGAENVLVGDDQMMSIEQQAQFELADFRNHLGANWATLVDEHWPQAQRDSSQGPNIVQVELNLFENEYRSFYKRMVELLSELKFSDVEQLLNDFWRPIPSAQATAATTSPPSTTTNQQADNTSAPGAQWFVQTQQLHNGQQQQATADIHHHIHHHQHHHHEQQQQPHEYQQHRELTFHRLYQLTSDPSAVNRINQIDYNLYTAIESFLLPDLLSPIPRPLSQQIRLFAKNIGPWTELAVKDFEPHFANEKSKSARAFGYALRRYTSLNHLSTASRAIWEKRSSLAQMSMDLSRVDLRDIEHQVSLMSSNNSSNNNNNNNDSTNLLNISRDHLPTTAPTQQCNNNSNDLEGAEQRSNESSGQQRGESSNSKSEKNISDNHKTNNNINENHHNHHICAMQPAQLIQNFLHLLEDPYPANSWPDWCRNLVESRVCGLSLEEARNFVLKWNFYISLIMKELTLRSAPSFGSFQLIRLLFDEYIFYLVVTRLAQAQNKTPAQLLSL